MHPQDSRTIPSFKRDFHALLIVQVHDKLKEAAALQAQPAAASPSLMSFTEALKREEIGFEVESASAQASAATSVEAATEVSASATAD